MQRRRGFTWIELAVMVGIVVLVLAILLPAALDFRETARRMQCRDNLKELGLALANYENAIDVLPPGWISSNHFGWNALLIPYLEERAMYMPWTFKEPWTNQASLFQRTPPQDQCPSDVLGVVGPPILRVTVPHSNYPGVSGATLISDDLTVVGKTRGAFGENSCWNFKQDFSDGLSNTFLVGERKSRGGAPENPGGDTIYAGVRDNYTQQGQALVIGDCAATNLPNFRGTKPVAITGFSSFHKGGVHFVLADGSVRFISDNINPTTYANLSTIDDGNNLSDF